MGDAENRVAAPRRSGEAGASWREEGRDILRAVSGAFIFGTTLVYTMEMWELGVTTDLWKLLLFLGVAFAVAVGLARSRSAGFKPDTDHFGALEQGVDVVAVGLVGGLVVLAVLNRVQLGDPPASVVGQVLIVAVPLSIGASVANAIFGPFGDKGKEGGEEGEAQGGTAWQAFVSDLGATIVGGIFVGFSVAPTAEIPLLAAKLDDTHELALIALSLALGYVIVFASGYGSGQATQQGPFQHPTTETAFSYLVSLVVALVCLFFFDHVRFGDPLGDVVSMVLVLGLPVTIGGAAGRLVV